MADFLNELAAYAIAAGGAGGTVGTDVFVGKQPADPADCVTLFGLPGSVIGDQREVPSLHFPRVQVITRAATYEDASAALDAWRGALHNIYGVFLPHFRILRSHAEQEGGPIGSDDQGRFEFSINFVIEYNVEDAPA